MRPAHVSRVGHRAERGQEIAGVIVDHPRRDLSKGRSVTRSQLDLGAVDRKLPLQLRLHGRELTADLLVQLTKGSGVPLAEVLKNPGETVTMMAGERPAALPEPRNLNFEVASRARHVPELAQAPAGLGWQLVMELSPIGPDTAPQAAK